MRVSTMSTRTAQHLLNLGLYTSPYPPLTSPTMTDYRPLIVADVQQSVTSVNNIIASLERDAPLKSDIIQMNYPQTTVDEFLRNSQAVVDASAFILRHYLTTINQDPQQSIRSASERTASWLVDTGDRISRNLDEARRVEDAARNTSSQLREAQAQINSTEESIRTSEANVRHAQESLASARSALTRARNRMEEAENTHRAVHIGVSAGVLERGT